MRLLRNLIRKVRYNYKFIGRNNSTQLNYVVNANSDSKLTDLMNFYGSDKGGKNNQHNYSEYYSELFLT